MPYAIPGEVISIFMCGRKFENGVCKKLPSRLEHREDIATHRLPNSECKNYHQPGCQLQTE